MVRSVQVTGTHLVTQAEVLAAADIRSGTPLIRINTSAVARRVEQLTPVQSAHVSRDWPDKIVISVQERTPALAVTGPGGFGLVDAFGVIVRQTASKPPAMPLLTAPVPGPGTSLRGSPAVRAAVTVLRRTAAPAAPPRQERERPGARRGHAAAGRRGDRSCGAAAIAPGLSCGNCRS